MNLVVMKTTHFFVISIKNFFLLSFYFAKRSNLKKKLGTRFDINDER